MFKHYLYEKITAIFGLKLSHYRTGMTYFNYQTFPFAFAFHSFTCKMTKMINFVQNESAI